MREVDIAGQTFGTIKVLRRVAPSKWECECPYCKRPFVLWHQAITRKDRVMQSCGCRSKLNRTHIEEACERVWTANYNDGDISAKEFMALSQGNCHYCNKPPSNKVDGAKYMENKPDVDTVFVYNGLDRLDSSKGHIHGNVVPCCKVCNLAKKKMLEDEFISHIDKIAKHWLGL